MRGTEAANDAVAYGLENIFESLIDSMGDGREFVWSEAEADQAVWEKLGGTALDAWSDYKEEMEAEDA